MLVILQTLFYQFMYLSKLFILLSFSFVLFSCNDHKNYLPADNALGAGREFIDACLKGDFDKASFYMLPDTENKQLLNKVMLQFQNATDLKKKQFSESSIIIIDVSYVSQKEVVINYKYSFDGYARKIKVFAQPSGNWLVDFKYANNGNL